MMDYPVSAFFGGSPIAAPKKKRSIYASVFDKFMPDSGDYSDEDKSKLARQGLLNLGLTMLQTGGGFGNALGAGLQGGLLAMNQGADNLTNDRYRKAMMARTTEGMDRNSQTEALMRETVRPDGTLDQVKFSQLAAVDPEKAKALRDAIDGPKTKWQLGRIGDGAGGEIDVFVDPMNPENMRTLDGQAIGPGAQAAQGPTGGAASLLGDAAASVGQATPQAGLLSPEQYQADYSLLAQAIPGTQITSRQRTPERNKAVGGVANSQHLTGTAADFVVPPHSKPAFIAQAKAKGYEAIDEGDHVHLELPPNRRRLSSVPPNAPMLGRRPAKPTAGEDGDKAANWQIVQGQDGTFYRVNKLTGETASAGVQGANALRQRDQDQKRAEALSQVNGTIESIDATIQQLETVAKSPGLGAGVGMSSMIPAIPGSARKDFDANLATLKAQNFIPMVSQLKGMGALSDAEGKKLTEAIGALDPGMSETEFTASLNKIKARLYMARAAASRRVGALKQNTVHLSGDTGQAAAAADDPLGIL